MQSFNFSKDRLKYSHLRTDRSIILHPRFTEAANLSHFSATSDRVCFISYAVGNRYHAEWEKVFIAMLCRRNKQLSPGKRNRLEKA
jgi:hypothetical protein